MTGMWITTGLILCILISWTCASPLQKNTGGDQDSDEDSDEEETTPNSATKSPSQNVTDQELTNKATLFLTRYFSNHGTEIPLHIPTNLNHTIVITVVPNNASSSAYENFAGLTEGPPTFGGDIPLFQSQQYHQQQQQFPVPTTQQQEGGNLTPINLFGFVRQEQLPTFVTREATEEPNLASTPQTQSGIPTTATTTTATTKKAPLKNEEPVDNIEDAILEALSIAGGEGGQAPVAQGGSSASPSQAVKNYLALLQSGAIPGLSNNNDGSGTIRVPSNFGTVFIQPEDQSTQPSGGTVFITPAPPAPAAVAAISPPALNPNIVLLQHLIPQNGYQTDENGVQRRPPGHALLTGVSGIIGSISEGNLGGVVQNTIKLTQAPAVQNTAKLATVAILHNVIQGLNPCNFLGNCRQRQRPPQKRK